MDSFLQVQYLFLSYGFRNVMKSVYFPKHCISDFKNGLFPMRGSNTPASKLHPLKVNSERKKTQNRKFKERVKI